MPGGFERHTQAQNVQYVSGNTKTLSNLCSQKLVTGPTGWSSTNLFVLFIFVSGSPRAIRLVGPAAYIGQVQIFHESNWYSICQDDWNQQNNLKNGNVVCRQLGYRKAVQAPSLTFASIDGDQGETIEGFNCAGNEARLDLCPILAGNWTDHKCRKKTAGVICQTPRGKNPGVRPTYLKQGGK